MAISAVKFLLPLVLAICFVANNGVSGLGPSTASKNWRKAGTILKQVETSLTLLPDQIFHTANPEDETIGGKILNEAGALKEETGAILAELDAKLKAQSLTASFAKQKGDAILKFLDRKFKRNIGNAIKGLGEEHRMKIQTVLDNSYKKIDKGLKDLIDILP